MSSSPKQLLSGFQELLQTKNSEIPGGRIDSSLLYAKKAQQNVDEKAENKKNSPARKKAKKARRLVITQEAENTLKLPPLVLNNPIKREKETLNHSNQEKSRQRGIHYKRKLTEEYRQECVSRDKDKHPLKYKIVAQHAGLKDEKVYGLKEADFLQIQDEYLKNKGLQNLREGCRQGIRKSTSVKCPNFNSYIHKIFRHQSSYHSKSNRSLHNHTDLTRTQKSLIAREDLLGKIVFQRVKEHLQKEHSRPNFVARVKTASAIDSALVHHIQTKIKRAQILIKR